MALPVAGLRSKQRAAALLTCSFPGPTCILSLTLSLCLPLQALCGAHLSVTGNDAAWPKLHADRIIAAPNQTAQIRGEATPHLIQISIEIGNLCARIMQATTANHSQTHTQSQSQTQSQSPVSTREANIYFKVSKIF